MDAFRWLSLKLSGALKPANKLALKTRFRVVNLTRDTVLASSLEVADTGETRRKGLLGRQALDPGEGLWIIPCESVHTFFMRFAVDLVYLDREKRIKKLRCNLVPWRISACLSAHSVVELPSGIIRASRTELEDVLEICPSGAIFEAASEEEHSEFA